MRVLYVEDAELLAGAVKHNLEKQGITTDLANNGEDGLDLAHKDGKCVIIVTHSANVCNQVDVVYDLKKVRK